MEIHRISISSGTTLHSVNLEESDDDVNSTENEIVVACASNGDCCIVATSPTAQPELGADLEIQYSLLQSSTLNIIDSYHTVITANGANLSNYPACISILPTRACTLVVVSHRFDIVTLLTIVDKSLQTSTTVNTGSSRLSTAVVTGCGVVVVPTSGSVKRVVIRV